MEDLSLELEALDQSAAVAPLEDRALLGARGDDRASFLQGMLSNDVARVAPGHGNYALLLSEQGKIVADLRMFVLADTIWLDVPAEARARVRQALERFIVADDVELEDLARAGVAVRGPRAAEVVARLAPAAERVAALEECAHLAATIAEVEVEIARVRDLGVDGFHLWSPDASRAALVQEALLAAGAVRCGPAALEAQRIAAGWARGGVDYDQQTLAAEVPSLARAISFQKGCYLGQEVIERVSARGHVNRLLVGLSLSPDPVIPAGSSVELEGREVGRVTSAVVLPNRRQAAIALVRAAASPPGTRLVVRSERATVDGEVVSIPIVSPS